MQLFAVVNTSGEALEVDDGYHLPPGCCIILPHPVHGPHLTSHLVVNQIPYPTPSMPQKKKKAVRSTKKSTVQVSPLSADEAVERMLAPRTVGLDEQEAGEELDISMVERLKAVKGRG